MSLQETKKVGVVLRPSTPELSNTFREVEAIFKKFDIEVLLDESSAYMIDIQGVDFKRMCEESDFIVSIGGDGTLISVVRRSYGYNIPVLGVHAGKLGFLADFALHELEGDLKDILNGDYRIDERAMLEAKVFTKNGPKEIIAFNDIVLTRASISKMIHLETLVDSKSFNTYFGDGVIVSTPTGSTAYNLSAGGPVLFPLTRVFALTPICPHSLTQRPVVLPGHFNLEFKTPDSSALIVVDGQDTYEMSSDDSLFINLAPLSAKLIHRKEFNYFEVLKEKLNWGDSV